MVILSPKAFGCFRWKYNQRLYYIASFTEPRSALIHNVNPSQLSGASHRSSDTVARSIIGCAARHSNASRYNTQPFDVIPPNLCSAMHMHYWAAPRSQ